MSTWGQLRMILATGAPDVSLDLLDSYLNTRYSTVLSATDWIGLKAHATVQTTAAYQSIAGADTATFTVGSNAVAGVATAWTNAITGQNVYRPGDTATYVATYVSSTSLTLDRPYEGLGSDVAGAVYAATPYVFMQNVYALPADVRGIVTVLNPLNDLPMAGFTKDQLDASTGPRTLVADPTSWAEYDDSTEPAPPASAPAVVHRIEFYPPPLRARGFPLEYLRDPYMFDGTNTSRSPLPFVTDKVLLDGARADIATGNEAIRYEASFSRELTRMLLVEHTQRRVKAPILMASRFTRHRLARAARGSGSAWRGGTPGGAN
jgi:hypothetical protein